jgi:hypothetical protein
MVVLLFACNGCGLQKENPRHSARGYRMPQANVQPMAFGGNQLLMTLRGAHHGPGYPGYGRRHYYFALMDYIHVIFLSP